MNWSQSLECGYERFDASNQCLLFVLQQIFDTDAECGDRVGCGPRADCGRVRSLLHFARRKFAFEERIMRRVGFPGLADHAEDHRHLLSRIESRSLSRNCEDGMFEVRQIADLWMPWHVVEFDRMFAQWAGGLFLEI